MCVCVFRESLVLLVPPEPREPPVCRVCPVSVALEVSQGPEERE